MTERSKSSFFKIILYSFLTLVFLPVAGYTTSQVRNPASMPGAALPSSPSIPSNNAAPMNMPGMGGSTSGSGGAGGNGMIGSGGIGGISGGSGGTIGAGGSCETDINEVCGSFGGLANATTADCNPTAPGLYGTPGACPEMKKSITPGCGNICCYTDPTVAICPTSSGAGGNGMIGSGGSVGMVGISGGSGGTIAAGGSCETDINEVCGSFGGLANATAADCNPSPPGTFPPGACPEMKKSITPGCGNICCYTDPTVAICPTSSGAGGSGGAIGTIINTGGTGGSGGSGGITVCRGISCNGFYGCAGPNNICLPASICPPQCPPGYSIPLGLMPVDIDNCTSVSTTCANSAGTTCTASVTNMGIESTTCLSRGSGGLGGNIGGVIGSGGGGGIIGINGGAGGTVGTGGNGGAKGTITSNGGTGGIGGAIGKVGGVIGSGGGGGIGGVSGGAGGCPGGISCNGFYGCANPNNNYACVPQCPPPCPNGYFPTAGTKPIDICNGVTTFCTDSPINTKTICTATVTNTGNWSTTCPNGTCPLPKPASENVAISNDKIIATLLAGNRFTLQRAHNTGVKYYIDQNQILSYLLSVNGSNLATARLIMAQYIQVIHTALSGWGMDSSSPGALAGVANIMFVELNQQDEWFPLCSRPDITFTICPTGVTAGGINVQQLPPYNNQLPSYYYGPFLADNTDNKSTVCLSGNGLVQEFKTTNGNILAEGTWIVSAVLHEVGHAIGLKHPGNYVGGGGASGPYLPANLDSTDNTVMSYNPGKHGYPWAPQVYDILAARYLYGAP